MCSVQRVYGRVSVPPSTTSVHQGRCTSVYDLGTVSLFGAVILQAGQTIALHKAGQPTGLLCSTTAMVCPWSSCSYASCTAPGYLTYKVLNIPQGTTAGMYGWLVIYYLRATPPGPMLMGGRRGQL